MDALDGDLDRNCGNCPLVTLETAGTMEEIPLQMSGAKSLSAKSKLSPKVEKACL